MSNLVFILVEYYACKWKMDTLAAFTAFINNFALCYKSRKVNLL